MMNRLPNYADDFSQDRRRGSTAEGTDIRLLGPLSCFVLGFVAGLVAMLLFADTNILRYYVINAFH